MSTKDKNTIEATVIEDTPTTDVKALLKDISSIYEATKTEGSKQAATLTDNFTIKGLTELKDHIIATMQQLNEIAQRGKPEGVTKSITNKLVVAIGAENTSLGKWFGKKLDEQKVESIQQETITNTIKSLMSTIEAKREEALDKIEKLSVIRQEQIKQLKVYETLEERLIPVAESLVGTIGRTKYDIEQLLSKVKASILKINIDIKSIIDPMISVAEMTIQKIQQMTPDIENGIQTNAAYAAFQESLSTLHDIAESASELGRHMTKTVHANTKDIIYRSIETLSNTGIDINAYEQLASEEAAHQKKISELISKEINNSEARLTKIADIKEKVLAIHTGNTATALLERN